MQDVQTATRLDIRPATSSDIPYLMALDHGYSTDYVWQMALQRDPQETSVAFREIRLPRPMRVKYPRDPRRMANEWVKARGMFIAEDAGHPIGYVSFIDGPAPDTVWVTDLVVGLVDRRQGVGTQLLREACIWCSQQGLSRLFLEMQSKNFPALCLARKIGMIFTGYSDRYYPDQDIALFFALDLQGSTLR